jgi:Na+-translocating ferredoxin:NAD+ oxidoreductase RnfD subunit
MTAFLGAVALVIGGIALMKVFGVFSRALQAVHTSRSALEVMNDPAYGDDRKAALLQAYSISLLRSFVDLLIRGVGSIAIPVGLLWTLECAGLLSLEAVWDLMRSWAFLLGGGIAAMAAFWLLEQ